MFRLNELYLQEVQNILFTAPTQTAHDIVQCYYDMIPAKYHMLPACKSQDNVIRIPTVVDTTERASEKSQSLYRVLQCLT